MAVFSGPSLPTANLVLALDASSVNAPNTYSTNLLFNRIWVTGNSSSNGSTISFYNRNGAVDENERIYDITPAGTLDVVWSSPSNDATSDGDGGWNTDRFTIDATKKYRYSVWIRKKDVIGNGRAYLGIYAYDANSTNIGVYNSSDGTTLNTNFYFTSRRFNASDLVPNPAVNEWVLFVGHVWPAGSVANTTPDPDTGVWKQNGTKIASASDCNWHPNATQANHRSYQFHSTTTNEKQQWWQPRVDIIDGTQPSLASLLAGYNDTNQFDLRKQVRVRAPSSIKTADSYRFSNTVGNVYNNYSECITIDSSNMSFVTEQTVIMCVRPTYFGQRRHPFYQSYYSYGEITQETNGQYTYYCGSGANTTTYTSRSSNFNLANNEIAVVAVTRNSNNIVWFKNGVYDIGYSNPYPTTTLISTEDKTMHIGWGRFSQYGFVGDIYFVYVYDRALSNTEIKQNFEAVRGRYGL